jgi:hypothetical protein
MLRSFGLAFIGFVVFCNPAQGFTITTGGSSVLNGITPVSNQGQFSTVANANTIDFNSGSAPTSGVAQYSATNNVVTGNVVGKYASPPNNNSAFFTVGPSTNTTATITFTQSVNYFGFFAGSLDSHNSIQFLNGNTVISTLSGTQIASLGGFSANGDQKVGLFINIYPSSTNEFFNRIILSSSSFAFETDNHAYRIGNTVDVPVPEPNPLPAVLTFGLSTLLINRYKSRISRNNGHHSP